MVSAGLQPREAAGAAGINFDGLGVFWTVYAIVWTLILVATMAYLWSKRRMPLLRVRGLPLSFAAILQLHCYWLAVQLGYVYGALMATVIEYWIMAIWLPFGIALFHASNSRFLYVANAQKRFIRKDSMDEKTMYKLPERKTLMQKWTALDWSKKVLVLVTTGMILHLTLTIVMFLVSRKFHPSFGIPGTEVFGSPADVKAGQGRGWEWWPSVFWQFFWAWIVAPIILWQSRNLQDTQGWRIQTIACCIANLHATPMWLIALYVPAMSAVNKYFIPPQWIAISIQLIEIFTVFIPCWEVLKQQSLSQETLNSIQKWEDRKRAAEASGNKSIISDSTAASWASKVSRAQSAVSSSSGGSILTMEALEHTLAKNPEPLQHFSALRDFSGENIAFLMQITEWRKQFYPIQTNGSKSTKEGSTRAVCRESFEKGLRIYIEFVSSRGAEFQVNLSSQDMKRLESIFEPAAKIMYGDKKAPDPATPFADIPMASNNGSQTAIVPTSTFAHDSSEDVSSLINIRYWGDIPDLFDESVWDDAETSIKYLVLTNTWPKFIRSRKSFDSVSTSRLSRAETAV